MISLRDGIEKKLYNQALCVSSALVHDANIKWICRLGIEAFDDLNFLLF